MPAAPERDEVHVVLVPVGEAAGVAPRLIALLDEDERARAAAFATGALATAYVVAHAVTRVALAEALGVAPHVVSLGRAEHGKPHVRALGVRPIRFNLSHAATLAAVAITRGREVGIDVEDVRPVVGAEEIAARHLPAAARAALARTPPERLARDFLQAWTRREAELKALGVGLAGPRPAAAAAARKDPPPTGASWASADLSLGCEHVASLVVAGGKRLRIVAWRAKARGRGDPNHPFVFERADVTARWT